MLAEYPEALEVMMGESEAIEGPVYWRTWVILRAAIRGYENQFYQYRQGFLDDSEWEGIRREIATQLARPFNRTIWEKTQPVFSPRFRKVVNESLLED